MLKHKHLILHLEVKRPPKSSDSAVIFLSHTIDRVDMKAAKAKTLKQNPQGYYCDLPGNEGVTAVGILETSHTVLHSWDQEYPAKIQFDLYSCKDFDIQQVVDLCQSFGILGGNYLVIDRDTDLKVIEEGVILEEGVVKAKPLDLGSTVIHPRK